MSDDLRILADESARDARAYLVTVTEVASGAAPDAAIPMTLLALSQVLVMGARLGAIEDVIPGALRGRHHGARGRAPAHGGGQPL